MHDSFDSFDSHSSQDSFPLFLPGFGCKVNTFIPTDQKKSEISFLKIVNA